MRYMEGYPGGDRYDGRVETQFFDTRVTVFARIDTVNASNAVRILTARLAGNGFTTEIDSSHAEPSPPQGGLEDYYVEVQQMITTTVKVQAKNPESAARQVDHVNFKLPEDPEDWNGIDGYTYVVRGTGTEDTEILYEGDCQEFT